MKQFPKIVMVLAFLSIAGESLAQSVPPSSTAIDWQQRYQSRRRAARTLLITGSALTAAGLIWYAGENNSSGSDGAMFTESFDFQGFLILGGAAAVLGSVPLFISANRCKRKAGDLLITLGPGCRSQLFSRSSGPGFSLGLRFVPGR